MADAVDLKPLFSFLRDLRANNNREWFEGHRAAYETAQGLFERLVGRLLHDLSGIEDLGSTTAKDCMMRIFRDVRFSKDKTPYKTGFGADLGPGGKHSSRAGFHLHVSPGDSMLAGGWYVPSSEQLARFRAAIDRDPAPFAGIVAASEFTKAFGGIEGELLKSAPQGYPRDHPEIELLRHRQIYAIRKLRDAEVLDPGFPAAVVKLCKAMKPLVDYLNRHGG